MIHRDLCNPMNTKNYSPLQMQFYFLLSRSVCWDGLVPLTKKEIAAALSCDMQSITKFIKKGVRDHTLYLEGNRLFLVKRVTDFSQGYIKHFPFLESAKFKALSIHTQRFILYTLWAGVHTNRPLKRDLSSLYHSGKEAPGVLNVYSKKPIYFVLEEASQFLKIDVTIKNNKETVHVSGLHEAYLSEQALENQGERKLVLNMLDDHFCGEVLSENSLQDILKIKKHYFTKLQSVGMELFFSALKKLFSLHKLYELNTRGEIGAYLKSTLKDLEEKLVSTLQKRVEYTKNAITYTKSLIIPTASKIALYFQSKLDNLTEIMKKIQKDTPANLPFPFYNWLEGTN